MFRYITLFFLVGVFSQLIQTNEWNSEILNPKVYTEQQLDRVLGRVYRDPNKVDTHLKSWCVQALGIPAGYAKNVPDRFDRAGDDEEPRTPRRRNISEFSSADQEVIELYNEREKNICDLMQAVINILFMRGWKSGVPCF